jgi:succinate dehydrogenase / fumarate reductase cytochrome b subunit
MSATSSRKQSHFVTESPLFRWAFSSLGKKCIVATTGSLLILFLIGHMLGNFTLYFGYEAINSYAEKLKSLGPLLWMVRLGLLAIFAAHVGFTILLVLENRAAAGGKYFAGNKVESNIFVKTMKYTGLVIFAFVVFHLAHFTLGLVQPDAYHLVDPEGRHDVYSMVVLGFQNVPISVFYILGMVLIGFHLSHGIGSLFQTLGLSNKTLRPLFDKGGFVLAWLIALGFITLPVSVLTGFVKLPEYYPIKASAASYQSSEILH